MWVVLSFKSKHQNIFPIMKPIATLLFASFTIFYSCKKEKLKEPQESVDSITRSLALTMDVRPDSLGINGKMEYYSDFTLINNQIYVIVLSIEGSIIRIDPFNNNKISQNQLNGYSNNLFSNRIPHVYPYAFLMVQNSKNAWTVPTYLDDQAQNSFPWKLCFDSKSSSPPSKVWNRRFGDHIMVNCAGTPRIFKNEDAGEATSIPDLNEFSDRLVTLSGDTMDLRYEGGQLKVLLNGVEAFSKNIPNVELTLIKGSVGFVFTPNAIHEIKLTPSILHRQVSCNSPSSKFSGFDIEIHNEYIIKPVKITNASLLYKGVVYNVINRNSGEILYHQEHRPQYHNGNLYYLENNILWAKNLSSGQLEMEVPLEEFSSKPFQYLYLHPETMQLFLGSEERIIALSLTKKQTL